MVIGAAADGRLSGEHDFVVIGMLVVEYLLAVSGAALPELGDSDIFVELALVHKDSSTGKIAVINTSLVELLHDFGNGEEEAVRQLGGQTSEIVAEAGRWETGDL